MSFLSVLFLSVGLAMDCLAVSIASGSYVRRLNIRLALRLAFFFGFFQSLMAALGMVLGRSIRHLVQAVSHWVAFLLLAGVGIKMIWESFKLESENTHYDPFKLSVVVLLALATSIDALAAGISFSFVNWESGSTILTIGLVSFFFSLVGTFIGERAGHIFENKIEIAGGVILILIGLRILLQHFGIG